MAGPECQLDADSRWQASVRGLAQFASAWSVRTGTLLADLRRAPVVPAAAHVAGPRIMAATGRALARAGCDLADDGRSV